MVRRSRHIDEMLEPLILRGLIQLVLITSFFVTRYVLDVLLTPAVIDGLDFAPTAHVNYESTVMPMKDGLPKFKDFPAEMGGSGEMLSE